MSGGHAAPVLAKGATTRKLYLPEGVWKDVKSGQARQRKRWIEVQAPLDALPVFVRDGSAAAGM